MNTSSIYTNDIVIPTSSIPYILLQRTEFQRFSKSLPVRAARKLLPKWPIYNLSVQFEAQVRGKSILASFRHSIAAEFRSIERWLPTKVTSILDIGCGIGGIDVHMYRHYRANNPSLYLLDKSEVADSIYYSFRDKTAFYNSFVVTEHVLLANDVPKGSIHLLEATPDNQIQINEGLSLVTSLISWGYHYPVSVYLDRVYELLEEGGHVILDIRRDTGQEDQLEAKFGNLQVLSSDPKKLRVLVVR